MAFMDLGKRLGVLCAPAFLMAGCVSIQGPGGCEAYDVPSECYSALEFGAFMTYGQINFSNIGNGAIDKALIIESAFRNMTDEGVVADFRAGLIGENPNTASAFDLAGRILDARDEGVTLRLRGDDLQLLDIDSTVVIIEPEAIQNFLDENETAIEDSRIAGPRGISFE